jgi:glycosyltransferase involved in cell wall biosynthesis
MRIVEVILSLEIGGQERLVTRLGNGLSARGHDVHVVTLTRGGALRDELANVAVHEVPRGAGIDRTLWTRLWRLFRGLRPDVVHTHNAVPLEFAAPAARLAGVRRVVHTKHGDFRYSPRARILARTATRFVHRFVAVSKDTATAAQRNEAPPLSRLSVIENGIPLGAFGLDSEARAAVRAEFGIPTDATVVGSVGRLVPEKDFPLLVRAMTPLVGPNVHLMIAGEGPARGAIENAIGGRERAYIHMLSARRDIPRVLNAFDLFASSSRTEGLPLAIPEAMASHLPIVATAVGGVPSMVPAHVGKLVPHGDVDALRDAIAVFVNKPPARHAAGKEARAYAIARFSEERMFDEYIALYT